MEAWSAFRDWGLTFSDPDVARQAKFPKLYVEGSIPFGRAANQLVIAGLSGISGSH